MGISVNDATLRGIVVALYKHLQRPAAQVPVLPPPAPRPRRSVASPLASSTTADLPPLPEAALPGIADTNTAMAQCTSAALPPTAQQLLAHSQAARPSLSSVSPQPSATPAQHPRRQSVHTPVQSSLAAHPPARPATSHPPALTAQHNQPPRSPRHPLAARCNEASPPPQCPPARSGRPPLPVHSMPARGGSRQLSQARHY